MDNADQRTVNAVRRTLHDLVLPFVEDPWAASYLRSAVSLLTTFEARLSGQASADEWEEAHLNALLASLHDLLDEPMPAVAPVTLFSKRIELERLIAVAYGPPLSDTNAEAKRLLANHRQEFVARTAPLWRSAGDLPQM